jgi:hypothetical protein
MFMGEITRHNNTHKAKGADDGVAMTAFQAKALFMLLDDDESGELEPDEIFGVLEERQLLGPQFDPPCCTARSSSALSPRPLRFT